MLATVGSALSEPGNHPVDVPITCVLTRFKLRSARHLIPTYLDYRNVVRHLESAEVPGFLRCAFLVENSRTWYSLSFWREPIAISHFGTAVQEHVGAGHRGFSRLASEDHVPEMWSTKWTLASVSNNLSWQGFDLRDTILSFGSGADDGR